MAASDPVAPLRSQLLVGDVSFNRALSESLFNKVAGETNFINSYQVDQMRWPLNGLYSVATGITLFDGLSYFFYNSEITGVYFWNGKAGTSGTTDFDVIWQNTSGVTQGSIFSVTPKISSAAANVSSGFRNLVTTNDFSMTGVTLPTLSKTTFLEGERIYLKLNSAMVSANNCGLAIFWRPTN